MKFGVSFVIEGVKDRSGILFHKGNTARDTRGCIILGESFEPILGIDGIAQSGHAFAEFMKILEDTDNFSLKILQLIAPPSPLL